MERASIGLAALAGSSVLLIRCYLITPYSDLTSEYPPSADGGPDAAADVAEADAGGEDAGCPSNMIAVPASGRVGGVYCVGASEVTFVEYQRFYAASLANFSLVTLPAACAWKTSYNPGVHRDVETIPITGVDWCDAYAYCAWIGGHLCGRIGGGTLVTTSALPQNDPSLSQWYSACSKAGLQRFPYGDDYNPQACNGADRNGDAEAPDPLPVKSLSTCNGAYEGIFDMSGNVSEWADECDQPSNSGTACSKDGDGGRTCDFCTVRGGTWRRYQPPEGDHITCAAIDSDPRDHRLGELGLRCCAR